MAKGSEVKALAEKGDGTLTRVSGVWTYPGCPIDQSGTNLRLPVEYATDAQVNEAITEGVLAVSAIGAMDRPTAVRLSKEGEQVRVMRAADAGTPEAGTELPPNSRPSVDAGVTAVSPAEAAEQAEKSVRGAMATGEATERRGADTASRDTANAKDPTTEQSPRRGR